MSAPSHVRARPEDAKKSTPKDFAVRILFGGVIAVMAYLIGQKFGPVVGGLFLAFPAIMPASATLVEKHDGRRPAENAALGTTAGTFGLAGFGATVWLLGERLSAWEVLLLAGFVWLVVGFFAWLVVEHVVGPALQDQ